jgi:hypothetical protein
MSSEISVALQRRLGKAGRGQAATRRRAFSGDAYHRPCFQEQMDLR